MDRADELVRGTVKALGKGANRWISTRAQAEAARRTVGRRVPSPVPVTSACPSCGTARGAASLACSLYAPAAAPA